MVERVCESSVIMSSNHLTRALRVFISHGIFGTCRSFPCSGILCLSLCCRHSCHHVYCSEEISSGPGLPAQDDSSYTKQEPGADDKVMKNNDSTQLPTKCLNDLLAVELFFFEVSERESFTPVRFNSVLWNENHIHLTFREERFFGCCVGLSSPWSCAIVPHSKCRLLLTLSTKQCQQFQQANL